MNDLATLLSCALKWSGSSVSQPLKTSTEKLQHLFRPSLSSSTCLRVPSLSLKRQNRVLAQQTKPLLEEVAAEYLNTPFEVCKDELKEVPVRLLWNLSRSLIELVDARLRSSVLALVQYSSAKGNDISASQSIVEKLLSESQLAITPTTIITTFQTMRRPEMVDENKYMAPIMLEAIADVEILGCLNTIKIEAQGTIVAVLGNDLEGLSMIRGAEVTIDTTTLLQCLMEQARLIVRKAITWASIASTGKLHITLAGTAEQERAAQTNEMAGHDPWRAGQQDEPTTTALQTSSHYIGGPHGNHQGNNNAMDGSFFAVPSSLLEAGSSVSAYHGFDPVTFNQQFRHLLEQKMGQYYEQQGPESKEQQQEQQDTSHDGMQTKTDSQQVKQEDTGHYLSSHFLSQNNLPQVKTEETAEEVRCNDDYLQLQLLQQQQRRQQQQQQQQRLEEEEQQQHLSHQQQLDAHVGNSRQEGNANGNNQPVNRLEMLTAALSDLKRDRNTHSQLDSDLNKRPRTTGNHPTPAQLEQLSSSSEQQQQ